MTLNKNTVSVSYIGDLVFSLPEQVVLVENDADYVQACYKLTQSNEDDSELRIWVRSKTHVSWLRAFTEQIKVTCSFDEKTPRIALSERWNVELPDWLTDSEVVENRLLDVSVNCHPRTSFENRFLSHFLGAAFTIDIFNASDLVSVLSSLVSEEAKAAFKEHPLMGHCLDNKCEKWALGSDEEWVKLFCKYISKDPVKVWHWLSFWSILWGYPAKLLEFVIPIEQAAFVRKIPPSVLSELPLEAVASEQIQTQITLFLEDIGKNVASSDDFLKVVKCASGRLSHEYKILSKILGSAQFSATEVDVQALRSKFEMCVGLSEIQLNSLSYFVKPNRPTLMKTEEDLSPTEWVRWATEEYIPYRTWQEKNNCYDADLERTVCRFSDWCIKEYASIHKDPDLSVAHALRDISSRSSDSEFTIILLVDCLPLHFMKLLDSALRNVDLNRHNLQYRFAGLPTVTEYNKIALLSGDWQSKGSGYEAILKKRSESDWCGKKVVYFTSLKALSDMATPQEATIAILNFLDGDETLHSDVESKNTTYEDELYRLFVRIAETLKRLSQAWSGPREHFSVYVVTDHGACRVLEEEKQSFESAVIKKLFENEKHRFSTVPDQQIKEVPENLWEIGYKFKQPFSPENVTFFLPKGHNTVRNASATKGYLHGGVTPEEVIVPLAQYKMIKATWKPLAGRFLNLELLKDTSRAKVYVLRVETFEIELQNPNTVDVRILRATVLSPETDIKSCEIVSVPAKGSKSMKIDCYFQKTALGQNPLEVEITYEIGGEKLVLSLMLECEFKSATSSGFSLKDI